MKRRILALLLSAAAAFGCVFGLSACSDDGETGTTGTEISRAYIDADGNLILVMTDDSEINCGKVTTENLYYKPVTEDGETVGYSVRGIGNVSDTDIVIPQTYRGLPVTAIGEDAFSGVDWVRSVQIPDSVTSIGASAFYECTNLESVSIGSGVTQIGSLAFAKCENLKSLNVCGIAEWCAIEFGNLSANPMYFATELYINGEPAGDIVVPDSVTAIPDYAFYECGNITGVVMDLGVKSVGASAFYGCEKLATLNTGDGVETIGELAFAACSNLLTVEIGSSVADIGGYAFYDCGMLSEIVLPPSMRTIGELAFASCGLMTVTLNDGLETIGDAAFTGCSLLQSFIMPDSVTSIGFGVAMFGIGGGGFVSGIESSNSLTQIRISNSLTEISDFAFSNTNITSIVIGEKVQMIKYSSFYGCALLESIVIPKSVTAIESYAFYKCTALGSVYYEGTAEEWSAVKIGKNGNEISNATVYCYSEQQPETQGNFWHYVGSGQIEIW